MNMPNHWKDFIKKHTNVSIDFDSEKVVRNKSLNYLLTIPVYPLIYGKTKQSELLAIGENGLYTITDNPHKTPLKQQTIRELVKKFSDTFGDNLYDFYFYEAEKEKISENKKENIIPEIIKTLKDQYFDSEKVLSLINLAGRKNISIAEIENAISKDAYASYKYAADIIHDRFPLGEPTIAKDATRAILYLEATASHDRWLDAEPAMANEADIALKYVKLTFLRFKEAEAEIFKFPTATDHYVNLMFDFYPDHIKLVDLEGVLNKAIKIISEKVLKAIIKECILNDVFDVFEIIAKNLKKHKVIVNEDSLLPFLVELRKHKFAEILLRNGYKNNTTLKIAEDNDDTEMIKLLGKYQ